MKPEPVKRHTARGIFVGLGVFLAAIVVLVFIIPDEFAWVGTLVALAVAIPVGRKAAEPSVDH